MKFFNIFNFKKEILTGALKILKKKKNSKPLFKQFFWHRRDQLKKNNLLSLISRFFCSASDAVNP